jgi:hypothetical protein
MYFRRRSRQKNKKIKKRSRRRLKKGGAYRNIEARLCV